MLLEQLAEGPPLLACQMGGARHVACGLLHDLHDIVALEATHRFGFRVPEVGRATRLGQIATRFAGETFRLPDGREARFVRGDDGKKSHYHVEWANPDRNDF